MMTEQNELIKLLNDGFFNDAEFFQKAYIDKKGVMDMDGVTRLWASFRGRKYTMKYYMVHGNTIPTWGVPSRYRDPDEAEKVYKACLEEGVTWQEKLKYKPPKSNEVW